MDATPGRRLRVVVVDDVELARRRNVVTLESDDALDVVADAGDLRSVLPAVADGPVDVAVVALSQRGVASPGTLEVVRSALPGTHLVVLVGPRDAVALDGRHGSDDDHRPTLVARDDTARALVPAVRRAVAPEAGRVAVTA